MDNIENLEIGTAKTHQSRVVLPSIVSILFGLAALISSYRIASLIVFFGAHDERNLFISIISAGIVHLLASITSSILWAKNILWSRYPMMILAIVSTVILSFMLFSIAYFLWIVVAIIMIVYLFVILFSKPRQI